MRYKKVCGRPPGVPANEEVESILDILDKEMASAGTAPETEETSSEMDLLVSDLLGYLTTDLIEE